MPYLRSAAVQVVVYELVHEPEAAEPRAVLALRRQRAQQREALLRARQRAAVAGPAAHCGTIEPYSCRQVTWPESVRCAGPLFCISAIITQ